VPGSPCSALPGSRCITRGLPASRPFIHRTSAARRAATRRPGRCST
jgi:hypothetical protein